MLSVRTLMLAACSAAMLFSACNKNDDQDEPASGVYVSANVITYDSLKMYTRAGVITDTTILHEFISRGWKSVEFNLKGGTDAFKMTLKVNLDPTGKNNYINFGAYQWDYEIVSNDTKMVLMLSKDSVYKATTGTILEGDGKALNDFVDQLSKYRSPWGGYQLDTNNRIFHRRKLYAIVEKTGSELTYPLMTYVYSRYAGINYRASATYPLFNNYFNTDVLPQLGDRDTLLVQQSRLKLIKQ